MNCKKCGYVLSNQDQTCPNCGEVNELFNGGLGVQPTPVEPAAPVEQAPVTPVTPVAPVEQAPVTPVEPAAPVEQVPVTPVTPVAPVEQAPITPVTPTAPVEQVPVTPVQTEIPSTNSESTSVSSVSNKPKKNGLFTALVIILCLIILGLGGFIAYKLMNPKTTEEDTNKKADTKEVVKKKDTVNMGGIIFTVPEDVQKKVNDLSTTFKDKDLSYEFYFDGITNEVTYLDVRAQIGDKANEYKTNYETKGASYITTSEYSVGGRKFSGVSYYYQKYYTDFFATSVNDKYVVSGTITYLASSKDTAYKMLNELLSSAEEDKEKTFTSTIKIEQIVNSNRDVIKEIK